MENGKKANAADFLGVKILTPLEEKAVIGGLAADEAHHHTDEGRHHSHHDTKAVEAAQ